MLKLKRAYQPGTRSDGTRILVERLWARGLSKETLRVDAWLKMSVRAPNFDSGSATIRTSG
jgi:uncharacterized protein YeaO (DUF488 family)